MRQTLLAGARTRYGAPVTSVMARVAPVVSNAAMRDLTDTCAKIPRVDRALAERAQRLLDGKTKPRRSLGRLEDLACQFAAIRGAVEPDMPRKAVVVMGADHGVAEEGVSAYPQEVTGQMLLNFARGGAAINVLSRHVGARVVVVDVGVKHPPPSMPEVRRAPIAPGTRNFTRGPAMTRDQAVHALETGIGIAEQLCADGYDLIGIGDMGIGNTTASSAIASVLTGTRPEEVIGRGTGIDDATMKRKLDAVLAGIVANRPDPRDAIDVLSKVGGFEIAGLAGVVLGASAHRAAVVVDGFISSTAALAAVRIAPAAAPYLIASHRSVEPGHRAVLSAIGAIPLLDLDMRLGEGTGAALAMGIIDAAVRILREMATFGAAGVTDSGA